MYKFLERFIKYDVFKEKEEFAFMLIQVQPESSIDVQSINFIIKLKQQEKLLCIYLR